MKEFLWKWLFWASAAFCGLLTLSLLVAYLLYSTAPSNTYTPLFASGFGFTIGFFGLGAVVVFFFDKLSKKTIIFEEVENELFNRVIREMPFFFFALLYFFSLTAYFGIFLLSLTYIEGCTK